MDELTSERITQLAKSLKDHHLAGSMEDAYKRAKEIVLTTGSGQEKSIKELMQDSNMDQQVHGVEKDFKTDVKLHEKEKENTEKAQEEFKKDKKIAKHILEGAEDIIEMSEQIKK